MQAPAHLLSPGPKARLARPLGLGREFRLARPPRAQTQTPLRPTPWASGVSSVSPDPSWARAPAPLHPVRTRLPTHGARTPDVTGAVTPISQQGMVATIPTTLGTAALPLSLCDLTSFPVVYRPTVKEEWERLTSVIVKLSFPTVNMTDCSIADPTSTTPTGLGNPPREQPCCQPYLKDGMGKPL